MAPKRKMLSHLPTQAHKEETPLGEDKGTTKGIKVNLVVKAQKKDEYGYGK